MPSTSLKLTDTKTASTFSDSLIDPAKRAPCPKSPFDMQAKGGMGKKGRTVKDEQ